MAERAVTSELTPVEGEGSGRITVTLTGRDKPNLSSEIEVNVHGLPGDATFEVARRVDPDANGKCTGSAWGRLGSIATNRAGSGTGHFSTSRGAPFVTGFRFDIQYRVTGNAVELQSRCLTLEIP
jgi:hypothetical protein